MRKTIKYGLIILFTLTISCYQNSNQLHLSEMPLTTYQIVFYKNHYIRVAIPKIEGEGYAAIQLFDKNLVIIDEIPCFFSFYPQIQLINDSIYINTRLSMRSNIDSSVFLNYSKNFTDLGSYQVHYFNNYCDDGLFSNKIIIDSICIDSISVLFYKGNLKIVEKNIEDLFFHNYMFYCNNIKNGVNKKLELIPKSKQIYIDFFETLFNKEKH